MARPLIEANQLILKLSKNFANQYYSNVAKRERGINVTVNFNVNNILIGDLRQNMTLPDLLTPQERDNIINDLI